MSSPGSWRGPAFGTGERARRAAVDSLLVADEMSSRCSGRAGRVASSRACGPGWPGKCRAPALDRDGPIGLISKRYDWPETNGRRGVTRTRGRTGYALRRAPWAELTRAGRRRARGARERPGARTATRTVFRRFATIHQTYQTSADIRYWGRITDAAVHKGARAGTYAVARGRISGGAPDAAD